MTVIMYTARCTCMYVPCLGWLPDSVMTVSCIQLGVHVCMSHVWDGSQIGVMTVIMNTARCTCMYVHVWDRSQIGVMIVIMYTARCTCMYVPCLGWLPDRCHDCYHVYS